MISKEHYTIQNLFNGEVIQFIDSDNALNYVKLCLIRSVPITINYAYHYVNENNTMAQKEKTVVPKIVAWKHRATIKTKKLTQKTKSV